MTTQAAKANAFQELHQRPGAFIIPNPWDAGTARILASLGFEALATTSLGVANMLGRCDGTGAVTGDDILENCRTITTATELPVSADLENCFADEPRAAAEMIRRAAAAGVVGGSIEDYTGDHSKPIYDFDLAVERVQAADVLYAPGLKDLDTIRTVVAAVTKPVNVVMGMADPAITADQLAAVGVRRISVGGALSRVALAAFLRAAREMRDEGRFTFIRDMVPIGELRDILRGGN